jgi:hypothetical protein
MYPAAFFAYDKFKWPELSAPRLAAHGDKQVSEKQRRLVWGVVLFLAELLLVGAMALLFGVPGAASADEPLCGDVLCEEAPLATCGVPCDAAGQCPTGLQCSPGGYCWNAVICPPPAPDQPPPTPRDGPRPIL